MSAALAVLGARWPGDILVVDGTVRGIGSVGPPPAGARILRADGDIVTAGLVNCHHHLFQRLARGMAVGCNLVEWLEVLLPLYATVSPEEMIAAARLSLCELALAGVSTTVDHHFAVPNGDVGIFSAIAAEAMDIGLRLVLARGAIDLTPARGGIVPTGLAEEPDRAMESVGRLADEIAERIAGLRSGSGPQLDSTPPLPDVSVAVAPSSLFAVSRELLEAACAIARSHNLAMHVHLSESVDEEPYCRRRFGCGPVELLEELGWFSGRVWVAHGIHLSRSEMERMGNARVGVAHCPASNARLGSGLCPVGDLTEAGCPVGLGIDGAAANEAGGMMSQARLAMYLARLSARSAAAMSPGEAFALATAGGAGCLGRPELGVLAPGAPADLAVWPADDLEDFADPVDALVLGPDRPVRHLVVGGRVVVEEGNVHGVDLEALRAQVAGAATAMRSRA